MPFGVHLLRFTRLFMWIAVAGLVASVGVHVCSLLGRPHPLGAVVWALHIGVFVVFFPAVIAAETLSGGVERADYWKVVLRGCPAWMRVLFYALFCYAFVNFFAGMAGGADSDTGPRADDLRLFSGHWMVFYHASMAIHFSVSRLGLAASRTCVCGHELPATVELCDACGVQLPPRPIA